MLGWTRQNGRVEKIENLIHFVQRSCALRAKLFEYSFSNCFSWTPKMSSLSRP